MDQKSKFTTIKLIFASTLFILGSIVQFATPVLADDPAEPADPTNKNSGPEMKNTEKLPGFRSKDFMSGNKIEFFDPSCSDSGGGDDDSSSTSDDSSSGDPTKEQKIAETFLVGFDTQQDANTEKVLTIIDKYKIGGMFITGQGAGNVFNKEFYDKAKEKSFGTFIATADEEGGKVDRYDTGTPSAHEMGTKSDEDVQKIGKDLGEKMKGFGVFVNLAPVLDFGPNENSNHLAGTRAFSQDPNVVIAKSKAFSKGLQEAGITPTYKHFPGLGKATSNSDLSSVTINYSDSDARPFKEVIGQGGAVMITNAKISNLGGGKPGPENKELIDKLKKDFKFSGPIMTDDLVALQEHGNTGESLPDIVVNSFNAGVDLQMFHYKDTQTIEAVINAVKDRVSDERINDAYKKAIDLANSGKTDEKPADQCCGEGGGTSLSGDNNAAKAYNFFISKGLTPEQASGIIGNMIRESGVGPQRLQGTGLEVKTKAEDAKSNSLGYGIVQWTPAGKMIGADKMKGKNPNSLADQLEYLWWNMGPEGPSPDNETLAAVKATSTPEDAAVAFEEKFERAGVPALEERKTFAKAIYEASKGKALPPEIEASISKDDGGGGSGGSSSDSSDSSSSGGGDDCSSGSVEGYRDPFRDLKKSPKRVDGGIDFGEDGDSGPVYAIGPAKITGVWPDSASSGWPGVPGAYIKYEFTSGMAKGKSVYINEDITPKVKEGDTVDSNTVIAEYKFADSWMETGWAEAGKDSGTGYVGWSDYNSGGGGSYASNSGQDFDKFMRKIGGAGGLVQGPLSTKQPPADWPKW